MDFGEHQNIGDKEVLGERYVVVPLRIESECENICISGSEQLRGSASA